MDGFTQPFDAGGLDVLLGVPGQAPGSLPPGVQAGLPQQLQPQISPDDIIRGLLAQTPPQAEAPTVAVPSLEDEEEEARKQTERKARAYLEETPEKRAQRRMEELFGKKGERTGKQKANIFAEIVRTLGQGGPSTREKARAEAEQEYAKVAPSMQRELATASAERRAAEERARREQSELNVMRQKADQFQQQMEWRNRTTDAKIAYQEGMQDIAQRRLQGDLTSEQFQNELKKAQTAQAEARTEALKKATSLGPSNVVQKAQEMTVQEMQSKGLDPNDFEAYQPIFLRNLDEIGKSGKYPPQAGMAPNFAPRFAGYDPYTNEPVYFNFPKAGGDPTQVALPKRTIDAKTRDTVQQLYGIESQIRGVLANVVKNPESLGLQNLPGATILATVGSLSRPQQTLLQEQVRMVSSYLKQQTGVQYGFREAKWLEQVFPTVLAKDPRLYIHGLSLLYVGTVASRMMKQAGITPDDLDLNSVMDQYADAVTAQIGKDPAKIDVPSAVALLRMAADKRGKRLVLDDQRRVVGVEAK